MPKPYQKLIHSYQALGLRVGLTHTTIKKAYRNLIKEWHPDLHQQDPDAAEERAKEINAAFSRLKSASAAELKAVKVFHQSSRRPAPSPGRPKTRAQRRAKTRRKTPPTPPRHPPPPPRRRTHRPPKTRPGPKAAPPPTPDRRPVVYSPRQSRRGRDVIGEIGISAAEQVSGGHWQLALDTCYSCGGWGAAIDTELETCRACRGLGFQGSPLAGRRPISLCPHCQGRGCRLERLCGTCDGTGGSTAYTVKFSVPRGLGCNFLGIVHGLGHPGVGGVAPGDLYLLIVPDR